ncbi:unnamed protein product [Arabidopsis lyrata]|uniref:Expressed protein n=1 Tax=Arabidopsis lyrata subsp. lyrata TaxID=81972 RepID=D7KG14_ARALL|nr:expressed protein [Arabidopsis lyrata subsp. lyrata]CAH8251344.1 unnamed protein product [Arabidopsis lyrata]
MKKHVTQKFEASRYLILISEPVEKLCSDAVQDLLAKASFGYGKPVPPLQMLHEYALI